MSNKVPEKWPDSYEFFTKDEAALLKEVDDMEENSRWIPGITSKTLSLKSIDGPIFASQLANDHGLDYEMVYETALEGMKLIIGYGNKSFCVRDTARGTLCETAKLFGSALGRMYPSRLAETLNNGLYVARGSSLLLERYGKISAIHSDANGGYCVMPISELLSITKTELGNRFGKPDFKYAYNKHDYTYAVWELPDAQSDLINYYQQALDTAVSANHAINFMPAVRFSSSDTATSSAMLMPMFKLPSGTYFRLVDGIQVEHKRSVRAGKKAGVELYEEQVTDLFARFNECAEIIQRMGETEIWNPVNCLVGICNKLRIPRRYADAAREEVERYCIGNPCCSMHDIYLSMAECVGYAQSMGASRSVVLNLEESIAKVLTLDWKEFDVGGVVAWGNAA